MTPLVLTPCVGRPPPRRIPRNASPRFKSDHSAQLDPIGGSPELQVSPEHPARAVKSLVEQFDLRAVEAKYSALGRHGYHPRHLLGVWIYATLVGKHYATEVHRALQTDLAFRLLSGGHVPSTATLKRFRHDNAVLFAGCIEETVRRAREQGLIDASDIAVDSLRVRAHASTDAVASQERSRKRLKELAEVEQPLQAEEQARHEDKVRKHEAALALCESAGRSHVVRTSPSATMIKFPDGAVLPGHHVTVAVAGLTARIVIAVLVDGDASDWGKLKPITEQAWANLLRAGMGPTRLSVVADAGYTSRGDLEFAKQASAWADVIVPPPSREAKDPKFFGRDRFVINSEGRATCPAGVRMEGPFSNGEGRTRWRGIGCETCRLRSQCTDKGRRSISVDPYGDRLRSEMRARVDSPEGRARYKRRIGTVEPVFSNIESTMHFRRSSSRNDDTVVSEVLLKVLAHNISRLIAARRCRLVVFIVELEF